MATVVVDAVRDTGGRTGGDWAGGEESGAGTGGDLGVSSLADSELWRRVEGDVPVPWLPPGTLHGYESTAGVEGSARGRKVAETEVAFSYFGGRRSKSWVRCVGNL